MTNQTTTYRIGDAEVTRIMECQIPFVPPNRLFADWNDLVAGHASAIVPSDPDSLTSAVHTSVHSWLVRMPGHTILVDTGIGNGKSRRQPIFDHLDNPYLDRLAAAGVSPDDVDTVLLTHIHTDHVGWNTRQEGGRWVPLFRQAAYFMPQVGRDYFTSDEGRSKPNYDMFADSVLPVIEAGQSRMIGPQGGEVLPGLTYRPTPGHSIDHMSIVLASGDKLGLFAGDVMHNPVQVYQPGWNSCFCADQDQAQRSRMQVLDFCADRGATYFSSHFGETSAGRVARSGNGFDWRFE